MSDNLIELNKKQTRHRRILRGLETREHASVEELTSEFSLSEATIRRDLEELEQAGHIIRIRGGARILTGLPRIAREFEERNRLHMAEKNRIVSEVEKFISDNMVISIDGGTTGWLLAKKLKEKKNLTVLTHSLPVAEELSGAPVKLLVSGGFLRQRNIDFIGTRVLSFYEEISADIAIVVCDAIKPAFGIYKLSEDSAGIARTMSAAAERVFVIADHSKIGAVGTYRCLRPENVDMLFMDCGVSEENRVAVKKSFLNKVVYCE
jgi:DeoR/GlpR family transcriptional regulator of sugar metabolism